MAWAQANLVNVRQEVIKRLYTEEDIILGTASSGSTSTIVDVGSTDGVHLESGILSNRNFIGAYVYVPAVADPKWSRVTTYDPASGTLTFSPLLGATAGTNPYEIHYKLHPERINQFIKDRARIGSRQALDTIAEATAINMDFNVLSEGTLADAKRAIAKRYPSGDPERVRLLAEADEHEAMWQEGLVLHGYGESWFTPKSAMEETEANSVIVPAQRSGSTPGVGR